MVQGFAMKPGIYLVHKGIGETSFGLVRSFMDEVSAAGIRRSRLPVCHGGALDPFAEGLVLLLAGQATRLMDLLHSAPKSYLAEISWGTETDNGDHLGHVVETGDPFALSPPLLEDALREFLGWREQVPPSFSNKRIGGERAWAKAHRGEIFELPPSRVYLHEATFIAHDLPRRSTLRLVSGGGYYVRALARDLGRRTGARGHLVGLRRTAIGPWTDPGPGRREVITGPALFPWWSSRQVTAAELRSLRSSDAIERGALEPPSWPLPRGFPDPAPRIRALHQEGLAALLRDQGGRLIADPLLASPI
jgi:tRNA pseudouridine55 synthase